MNKPFEINNTGRAFLFDQEFCDVTFVVDGKRIKAHRVVLASQSDYFKTLFLNADSKEGRASEIRLEEPLEAFELLMKFVYGNKLELQSYQAKGKVYLELFHLAHKFGVQDLEKSLVQYFLHGINQENVLELLNFSVLHGPSAGLLREQCFSVLGKAEKHEIISKLSFDSIQDILRTSSIIQPSDSFYIVQKWLSYNPDCSEADKKKLIDRVDVNRLSNREILKILAPSKLFDDNHLLGILANREGDELDDVGRCIGTVIIGEVFNRNTYSFRSSGIILLKINSMAFGIKLQVNYNTEMLKIKVSKDLNDKWKTIQGTKEDRSYFASSDQPFNFISIERDANISTKIYILTLRVGLKKGISAYEYKEVIPKQL